MSFNFNLKCSAPEYRDGFDYKEVDFCGNDYQAGIFEDATNNYNLNADEFDSVFNSSADQFRDNYETLILDDKKERFDFEG